MDFDFNAQYKSYPNIELLKIVKRANDYQPSAVAAATEILNERVVTAEERRAVDDFYDEANKAKLPKVADVAQVAGDADIDDDGATNILAPVFEAHKKAAAAKWVNIFLLAIAIPYGWILFKALQRVDLFFQTGSSGLIKFYVLDFLSAIYVPVVFFLLYKKKRWGWILLFADCVFTFLTLVSQSYIFFKYQPMHHGNTFSFLFPICLKGVMICFLWPDAIAGQFGVTDNTKKIVAAVMGIGTILLVLVLKVLIR